MEQYLKDQIKIKLTGQKQLEYTINLYDNPFVKRWIESFKQILRSNLILEKNYCFIGFADSKRNLNFLCKELNEVVDQINKFNNTGVWQKNGLASYPITRSFEPDDFMYPDTLPIGKAVNGDAMKTPGCRLKHEACNELHRYFEDLQGTTQNLSHHYIKADHTTKWHIRQLNNLCHEIESWVNADRKKACEPEWMRPSQIVTFLNAPRYKLHDMDYELFKQNYLKLSVGKKRHLKIELI